MSSTLLESAASTSGSSLASFSSSSASGVASAGGVISSTPFKACSSSPLAFVSVLSSLGTTFAFSDFFFSLLFFFFSLAVSFLVFLVRDEFSPSVSFVFFCFFLASFGFSSWPSCFDFVPFSSFVSSLAVSFVFFDFFFASFSFSSPPFSFGFVPFSGTNFFFDFFLANFGFSSPLCTSGFIPFSSFNFTDFLLFDLELSSPSPLPSSDLLFFFFLDAFSPGLSGRTGKGSTASESTVMLFFFFFFGLFPATLPFVLSFPLSPFFFCLPCSFGFLSTFCSFSPTPGTTGSALSSVLSSMPNGDSLVPFFFLKLVSLRSILNL